MKSEEFEDFLTANEKRIYNYILKFVEIEEDAQDLVQNVFIAFYERLSEIEDKTALAYLYRTAHNMSINWLKHHKRNLLKAPEDFRNFAAPPSHSSEPDYRVLKQAIQSLPVKLSTVIHLQYYENLSYKEISAQLNISVKAVESLLVRAKRILRKKIMQGKGNNDVFNNSKTE